MVDLDLNPLIAGRLRDLRIERGLSQAAFGQVLGLTFQQIQKYEKGVNKISAEKLLHLARHFEVGLEYFSEESHVTTQANSQNVKILRNTRLRLEIARAIGPVRSTQALRAILGVIRSIATVSLPHTGSEVESDQDHAAAA